MGLNFLNKFKKIKVNFEGIREIRMGSPYAICSKVNLIGTKYQYDLENYAYQDKYLIINNERIIVLIKWSTPRNEPGFEPVIINDVYNKVINLNRIAGLCNDIIISTNGFKIEYLFDRRTFYKEIGLENLF